MTRSLLLLSNLLGASLAALTFVLGGFPWPTAALVAWTLFWLYTFSRRWDWAASLHLFLIFVFLAAASFLNLEPVPVTLSALLTLASWDLAGLEARLRLAGSESDTARIETRHLRRLGLTLALGAALVWAALSIRLQLSFEWIVVLSIFAAWGLGRMVHRLLKSD